MNRDSAVAALEEALGHRFRDRTLLDEALRHASAAHEQGAPSYERLEFLGDAALSHVIAALLFDRWPGAGEGQLTRGRAALVREASLDVLARAIGIPAALELGGRVSPSAAVNADALEAVLGALLLDAGWRQFRAAVRRLFKVPLAALDPFRLGFEEPKSTLQELAQRQGLRLPVYHQVEVRGPEHGRVYVFEVEFDGRALARGEGRTKRAAQQNAARGALEVLSSEE
ncbi:MAG: ribonuclease III [Acidobacteriota bacterium]